MAEIGNGATGKGTVATGAGSRDAKVLVVGDLHLKEELALERVRAIADELGAGRVIICGDYVDEWHSSALTMRDALACLRSWVAGARSRGLGVELVLGNHDMQYVLGKPGPGTHTGLYDEVREALDALDVKVAATAGGALVTHAGVTASWARKHLDLGDAPDADEVARQLNAMYAGRDRAALHVLHAAGPGRGGWEVPGPLWADRRELLDDPLPGVDQIVGHTPVESVEIWNLPATVGESAADAEAMADGEAAAERLAFVDTMSLTRSLSPIGDGTILLVEGGTMRAVDGEEAGLRPWKPAVWDWLTESVMSFL